MSNEENLILDIFDVNREGLRHIAERISLYLAYRDLVSLKRSCSTVYRFLESGNFEQEKLSEQLRRDWGSGEPRRSISLPFHQLTPVNNVKLVRNKQEIFVSTVTQVYNLSLENDSLSQTLDNESEAKNTSEELSESVKSGLKLNLRLPSTSLNAKINTKIEPGENEIVDYKHVYINENKNLEKNQITQFDILKNYLIAGNNNGILSIWDIDTAELLNSKQLFGIITGVRCHEEQDLIVTSHAGKAYDMGCITIRKLVSPGEMSVIWSAYQDVMPVFCVSASPTFIIILEWLGTFDMVHVGSATLYTRRGENLVERKEFSETRVTETWRSSSGLMENLDQGKLHMRFSTAGIFKEEFAAMCSVEEGNTMFLVNIFNLNTLSLLQSFSGHQCGIFQVISCGDLLVTRDKGGSLILWDAKLASDEMYRDKDPENAVFIRELDLPGRDKFLHIDMDLRRLAISKIGGVEVLDFWNASSSTSKTDTILSLPGSRSIMPEAEGHSDNIQAGIIQIDQNRAELFFA